MTQVPPSYRGSADYIVTPDLLQVVNAAFVLGRPLLVRGEPGTGKTMLAASIAGALDMELITWNIKSTTKAREGLYVYDTVQRLYDSQFGSRDVSDIGRYIKLGRLGLALTAPLRAVLLIDEIDKADPEFPNDLLWELDQMSFFIPETRETVAARERPVTIITSNAEKELPDAFLRRCVFHYIAFPDRETMAEIVRVHHPDLEQNLLRECLNAFYRLRDVPGLLKKPSTSELLDWVQALVLGGIDPQALTREMPFTGVLLKRQRDHQTFERYLRAHKG
ncbi:MAG: MoxR family ATPase [Peptococcaceae bacterium]|nr:MoxR family ATPase [Peptococcaceae bacterium]